MLSTLLFPAIKTRFAVALLLTFFPYGLLYPLNYPVGELLTLCCWIWVFPSRIGWMSLGLMPLIATTAYGYFAFNFFCLIANLSFAFSASRCEKLRIADLNGLYQLAKGCMIVTLVIAAVQAMVHQRRVMMASGNNARVVTFASPPHAAAKAPMNPLCPARPSKSQTVMAMHNATIGERFCTRMAR